MKSGKNGDRKMGTGPVLYERGHSQLEGITAENGACPHFFSGHLVQSEMAGVRSYAGAERNGEGMALKI
jgi:hypothetical protein